MPPRCASDSSTSLGRLGLAMTAAPTEQGRISRAMPIAAIALSVVVVAVVVALTNSAADMAWRETPTVANFRGFAEPGSTKVEGKSSYLYGAVAMQYFGVVLFAAAFLRPRRLLQGEIALWQPLAFAGWFFLLFLGEMLQVSRAMAAAGRTMPGFDDLVANCWRMIAP
jgi:hypothetical protein